jgi:tetratricopeptide (TPR) repeat protein
MTGGAAAALATATAVAEPLAATPDPASIFESVTVTQDVAPPPAMSLLPPVRPPRKTAIIGLGAGLGIVALGFAAFKLLAGTNPAPARPVVAAPKPVVASNAGQASPKADEARAAAPVVASAPAPAPEAAARPERAAPTRPDPEETAPARSDRKPSHRRADRIASHGSGSTHRGKRHEHHGSRMKVVVYHPAKHAAAAPEHADPRPPYERGNALLFAGDGKGAIAAYREAVHSAPSDPIGFRGLGLAYEQQGESAQAVRALRRYLKLAPNAPDREIISRRIERLSKQAKKS